MFLNEMQVGKSIEVYVYRDGYKYRLVSKIEDIREDSIRISLIANRMKVFHFLDTDKIEVVYRHKEQLWRWKNFKGNVAILDGARVHCLTLNNNPEGERYNRRNAFRVFLGEDITLIYYVPKQANKEEGDISLKGMDKNSESFELLFEEKQCSGFVKDLSENGIGIFTNTLFSIGDEIEFDLITPFGKLNSKAQVVRMSKETHGIYRNFYGCIFTASSKNLVKYIYSIQRKKLSNMKG